MEYKTISKPSLLLSCPVITIVKSIAISYIISIVLFLIFAFVITYTDISYSIVTPASVIITLLSIVTASIISGLKSTEKGWLTGIVTGFLYMFFLYIVGCIIFKSPAINSNGIIMIIAGTLIGAVGSIIGINNRKKYKNK